MMIHGYYTNKFIIISYRRSRLFSAKCKSIIPIMSGLHIIRHMSFHLSVLKSFNYMYFLIIFIISYLFLPSDLLPSILRHASNCHVALCPNHFFCRCLTTVNKHPFSPTYKALRNSFICQWSCLNMLYILLRCHISNTSNLFKMYKSVFSHHTLAHSTPEIFIIFSCQQ